MASAATTESAATPETPAASPLAGGAKLILLAALAGLAMGGGTGAVVLAPRLGGSASAGLVDDGSHGPAVTESAAVLFVVDNLVVNPAGTNGSRFLLVTTSIIVRDAASLTKLQSRDAEVRDRIVDFLSAKSVEELGDPALRDALKKDLAAAVSGLFAEGTVRRVLLPQFVLQ